MPTTSAGLLPYRWRDGRLEVFLVHPGGPFWARKDEHAWSIPKGEAEAGDDLAREDPAGEDLLDAARREFSEETGLVCDGPVLALTPVRQKGGKVVHAWAVEAELDPGNIRSNTFELEWPPRSGRVQAFPEVDRAAWIDLAAARRKIHKGQRALLDDLESRVGAKPG